MVSFVALQCDCCGVYILCPMMLKKGIGSAQPVVQIPLKECPTCYEPFEPVVHTLKIPIKEQMPQGGLVKP